MRFQDDYGSKEENGNWKSKVMPRRDTLKDSMERALWSLVAHDETHLTMFKMSDAWNFFNRLLEIEPRGDKCLLKIERSGDHYTVTQALLDKDEEPVFKTTKACYGRKISVQALDRSVEKYMGENEVRIMQNPNNF